MPISILLIGKIHDTSELGMDPSTDIPSGEQRIGGKEILLIMVTGGHTYRWTT